MTTFLRLAPVCANLERLLAQRREGGDDYLGGKMLATGGVCDGVKHWAPPKLSRIAAPRRAGVR